MMAPEHAAESGHRKRGRDQTQVEESSDGELQANLELAAATATQRPKKRQRVVANRSLFIRSLPETATDESLAEFVSQHYPVKHSTVVLDPKTKTSRGYGFVTLTDAEDTQEAVLKLDKAKWQGKHLRVEVAEPRSRKKGSQKDDEDGVEDKKAKRKRELDEARQPPKVIVRNLPWSIKKSEQLAQLFESFGKVKFADLPNVKGKLKGFGFVTMRRKIHAEKAIESLQGTEVDGRTLSVGWAVDKATWEKQLSHAHDGESEEATRATPGLATGEQVSSTEADVEAFLRTRLENLESESEPESGHEGDAAESEDDGTESKPSKTSKVLTRVEKTHGTTDNSSTVFIRNLPYTATDEEVKAFFGHFGAVRYARVVADKSTGRAAGTAFVCFFTAEDSKACVKSCPKPKPQGQLAVVKHSVLQDDNVDTDGRYFFQGRALHVVQAVGKDQATKLGASAADGGNDKDKRRLFLLNEGSMNPNSPLYSLLSASEIKARSDAMAQQRKTMQKNPLLHISLTRLLVRNLPRNLGSKELKELARKAVVGFAVDVKEGRRQPLTKEENRRGGDSSKESEHQRKLKGKGVVQQAKISFETKEGGKAPIEEGAKSRRFGFVEYSSHRWALMALRWLNGYQMKDDAGKKQRLMVQFAMDNAQVVHQRRASQNMSRTAAERSQSRPAARTTLSRPGRESKDMSVKKGQGAAQDEESSSGKDTRSAMEKSLIGRKRMMRNKKAKGRFKSQKA